jgi:carboxyl-terminal processing protease
VAGFANTRTALALSVFCSLVLALSCWCGGYRCSAQPGATDILPATVAVAGVGPAGSSTLARETDVVAGVCDLIAEGQLGRARERLGQAESADREQVRHLREVVDSYEQISLRRQASKEEVFHEQIRELGTLKSSVSLDKPDAVANVGGAVEPNELSGAEDPNDANDISDVLAVIAKATEFANDDQKNELLNDVYVKAVLEEAVDRSTLLEAQGKWLEAYTRYFYWLQVIDRDNDGYAEHADGLLDRAGIAASFQDSPCETRTERYAGVESRMFKRAIEALNIHYVNSIDYAEMATEGIRRCDLLAEVLILAFAEGTEAAKESSFEPPDPKKATAWSVALAGLRDEVEASTAGFGKKEFLAVLDNVLALNETTVNLPDRPLVAHFAEAALNTLDPYTVMVWPRQVQDFEKLMTNEFTGIGIEISKPKGLLTVASLLPDTPAYRSGLDAGDVIEAVDDLPTKDMSLMCAVKKITGPKGTDVRLTVRRGGTDKTEDITITRDRIIVPTIRGWQRTETGKWLYMLDETSRIGYVRITSFSGETADDLEGVLDDLESDGLEGLILDLRFNTGGLLDSAVKVVDKFMSEGLIVRTQPKATMIPAYERARARGTHPDYPLVILINSSSASASEIVAGALGDEAYERAVLVGTRTHGKGSVQGITHYPGGGAELKYTMAYYHLPSGQRVRSRVAVEKEGSEDWGVGPDVEVELTSEEVKTMLDVQRDNDVLVQAHRDENGSEIRKHSVAETLTADPQLAVALLVVKAKLVGAHQAVLN